MLKQSLRGKGGGFLPNELGRLFSQVIDCGDGLTLVGGEAVAYDFNAIIGPLSKLAGTTVADVWLLWGFGVDIVNGAALRADSAAGNALKSSLQIQLNDEDSAEVETVFFE